MLILWTSRLETSTSYSLKESVELWSPFLLSNEEDDVDGDDEEDDGADDGNDDEDEEDEGFLMKVVHFNLNQEFFFSIFFSNFFQTDEDDQDDGSDYEYDNQILDELGPI